jgi:rod shape determining protein RodA
MERSPIKKIQSLFFGFFAGLDRQLGLILFGLACVGFFTFLSASQNTPSKLPMSFAILHCHLQ